MAKIIPTRFVLNDDEIQVLQALTRYGAMQPSQLGAETLMLPADLNQTLTALADNGLVIVRPDETPDGLVVILTSEGRDTLNRNMTSQNVMRKGGK
jgi:DNA-binding MarR family transcriptional regulator